MLLNNKIFNEIICFCPVQNSDCKFMSGDIVGYMYIFNGYNLPILFLNLI